MTPRWERFKTLAYAALNLDADARARLLDAECANDADLRAEVEALLSAGQGIGSDFLEAAPPGIAAAGIEENFGLSVLGAGDLVAHRYRLLHELGQGGMGQVWLAEQIDPVRRNVALKLIRAGLYDAAALRRFATERQSLAIMDHPAIAKVFDAGATAQGQPYFIMEYVPGRSITAYCDERRIDIRARLELFIQTCEAVQHAHQKAIIHRDLKPANILVVEVDGRPVPKIIDFGIAKASAAPREAAGQPTLLGNLFGTPGYMSPEQIDPRGQDIDTRTDVYSLGVVLYVLLTGVQPFEVSRGQPLPLDQWLRRLREEDPPRPSGKLSADRDLLTIAATSRNTQPTMLVRQLRGDLDWIALRALERDRERRYATPSELAADLRRYLQLEPVLARPASASYQVGKFIRRHRVATAGAMLVGLLAIVASASAMIALRQEKAAEILALQALQAQARLLTQAAAQRLKDGDLGSAQDIILEVLTNPSFASSRTAAAISVFQDVRAADAQLLVLSGHAGRVDFARYSPDGARIITASEDKTARIWDAATGSQLAILAGHGNQVDTAEYSRDGKRILTASHDKTLRIWDADSGTQIAVISAPGVKPIAASFSPDGERIVAASLDATARIFDVRTGTEFAMLSGHAGPLQSAEYSPDGRRIVTASLDKTARVWMAESGAPLLTLSGHTGLVLGARYSPDGSRIVTASGDRTARVWDARTGKVLAVLSGHTNSVYDASYSPDGSLIATVSYDGTARIWDANSAAQLAVLSGHGGFVTSVGFSADGSRVVTASDDRTARVWVVRRRAEILTLAGHRDGVAFAAYSHDGKHIVTASLDRTVRIWDSSTGAPTAALERNEATITTGFSPDDMRIITGGGVDDTARIWDAGTLAPVAVLHGHGGVVESAVYAPDGLHIATASLDKTARIWDARSGAQVAVLSGHGGPVLTAAYSPDGRYLTTASFDKTARIWEVASGTQLRVLSGHNQIVADAAYSPDGQRVVTASFDGTARIWDAQTGEPLLVLAGHAGPVQSAAYTPDGTQILTASLDKTARIWDAKTGAQLAVLSGHQDALQYAAYAPDGRQFVSASLDRTARIWDARIPAGLEAQILWEAAAQTDPLPENERTELGVPPDAGVRATSKQASACDRAAAAPYDPKRLAPGNLPSAIGVDVALAACLTATSTDGHDARADYELGRTLAAKQDWAAARRALEQSLRRGYTAAAIDLADLLTNSSAGPVDSRRARALYEQAWRAGIPIGAFRLGQLNELETDSVASATPSAWGWYELGAAAGEPNALARCAERDERAALAATTMGERQRLLLAAFVGYARAAHFAARENWPDDAWQHWRYRRASLARVLAFEGHMEPVADAFAAVLSRPRS
jgi:WD40 repeat protein